MKCDYNNLWSKSEEQLKDIVEKTIKSHKEVKNNIVKIKLKIAQLKEAIYYAEENEKKQLHEELNWYKRKYNDLSKIDYEKNERLFINEPYFCKVVTDDFQLYVSKYKRDLENDIVLFTDAISVLRFCKVGDIKEIYGNKSEIIEKIEYTISDSSLKKLIQYKKDEAYIYQDGNITVLKGDAEHIKSAIEPEHTNNMGEIIDKMKEEQDKVMRAPHLGVTLINGGPGSGKTNIAIHRIRYLLNEFGNLFSENNMAVFCYNVALKEYLKNLIKELNLNYIKVFSYDKWCYKLLKKYTNINYINYGINLKNETESAYKSNTYVDIIFHYFIEIRDYLKNEIRENNIIKYYMPENFIFNDIISINDIFQLRDKIIHSMDDLYINDKVVNEIDKEFEKIINRYYTSKIDIKKKVFVIDIRNIIYEIYSMKEMKEKFKDSFFYYKGLFQNEVNRYELYSAIYIMSLIGKGMENDLNEYDHIVVDEVQDFIPIQLRTLNNMAAYSMTLSGDINQSIFNDKVKSNGLGIKIDNCYTLKEIHRSTIQTINFANGIINKHVNILSDNYGLKPILIKCNDFSDSLSKVKEKIIEIKLKEKNPSMVILYPDHKKLEYINEIISSSNLNCYIALKDSWDFTKDIAISTYHQVKGLEFDYVFILGLSEFDDYGYINKKELFYTIVTRARKRVYMYSYYEIPKIMENIDENLYQKSS